MKKLTWKNSDKTKLSTSGICPPKWDICPLKTTIVKTVVCRWSRKIWNICGSWRKMWVVTKSKCVPSRFNLTNTTTCHTTKLNLGWASYSICRISLHCKTCKTLKKQSKISNKSSKLTKVWSNINSTNFNLLFLKKWAIALRNSI